MKNKLIINGGRKLIGKCNVQTSKNAILPILSACMLFDGEVSLQNIPNITDVSNMLEILQNFGIKIEKTEKVINLLVTDIKNAIISEKLSKSMRSSIFLLAPLLMRFKNVMITLPGGCKIGSRPIDLHISAFKKLGAKVAKLGDNIFFNAENMKAKRIKLKIPSVGATENIVQYACLLKGKTVIINPAKEPEVVDLCNFLNKAGAKIVGAGTKKITIYGVNKLKSIEYIPIGDRIVAGTIMTAVAVCGGKVEMRNVIIGHNKKIFKILSSIGCQIVTKNDIITISSSGKLKNIGKIQTGYYPDFPTDLQSFMFVLSCLTKGKTIIKENLFENRFLIADELKKMGANIKMKNSKSVTIEGVKSLTANQNLISKDLRGGASLVIAALVANGKSVIKNIEPIDRGYECIEEIFSSLGADIKRI